jgi:hypothetical protein
MRFGMYRKALLLALPFIAIGAVTPAQAWSGDSTTYDPSVQSQFVDPDAAMDNLANSSSGASGTDLSVQSNGTGSAHAATHAPANPADAEPVNPGWPLWMQWHQQ